jgi:Ser/Thr protein kinase RdoA (MazF antagonist)
MYLFIPGSVTYQQVEKMETATEAGRAIGVFQSLLSDLKNPLIETIPDFHDINLRISQYNEARKNDPAGRADEVGGEMRFAENHFERMVEYFRMLKTNAVARVTHNDTKLNNILFDASGKAICLIDLDTVMPGYIHFDYGDALRTMACSTAEDEADLSKVFFRKDIYEYFTSAYLEQTRHFLNPEEIRLLPYAPVYMTFIIGLRFLTDYINGDVYYRVRYPGHNLVRARVQFKLIGYST